MSNPTQKAQHYTLTASIPLGLRSFLDSFTIEYSGSVIAPDGSRIDMDTLKDLLVSEAMTGAALKPHEIEAVLSLSLKEVQRRVMLKLLVATAFSPIAQDGGLHEWLLAVTGDVRPLDLVIMKHFCWLVKRKMRGLSVRDQVMPVLFSREQGTYKSTAMEMLASPLSLVSNLSKDLSLFSDSREHGMFTDTYIIGLDELAKSGEAADVDQMKRMITEKVVSYRPLYSKKQSITSNVSTFIATSNKPVSQVIGDETGARRFWSVNVSEVKDPARYDMLASIDYAQLWQSIDENLQHGYFHEHQEEINEVQKATLKRKNSVELWAEEQAVVGETFTPASALYMQYRDWTALNGFTAFHSNNFGIELMALKGVQKKRAAAGATYNLSSALDADVEKLKGKMWPIVGGKR